MKKINIYITFSMLFIASIMTGCEKNWLDINTDPNSPTEVPLSQLLPSTQVTMAYAFGNDGAGLNGYAGSVMHHYVQRGTINDYGLTGSDFNVTVSWTSLYAGALTDLNNIIAAGTESGDMHYVGIAKIMKSYIFASMVDVWGEVPYFEANGGSDNPYPTFDGGAAIYADLHLVLDDAITNLAAASNFSPSSDDLIYGGNLDKWRKLAKTLKLRMYNNVRAVENVNTQIAALLTENDLIVASDDFQMPYGTGNAPENRNPGFVQEWSPGGANYYISPYFYEIMRSQDTFGHNGIQFVVADPRIPYYFYNQLPAGSVDNDAQNPCAYCPSDAGTSFLSIYNYSFNIDPNEGFDQSSSQTIAGLYPVGGAVDNGAGGVVSNASSLSAGQVTGPGNVAQRLLTFYERKYIEAELALAGTISGNARTLLIEAMDASFDKVNEIASQVGAATINGTSRDLYKNAVLAQYDIASADGQLEIIMTQKWIASFGNSIVSYNDYRRTGYPRLHDGNTDNLGVTVQTRQFPVSFPYDIGNLQLNPNAPAQRVVASDKVFWDN